MILTNNKKHIEGLYTEALKRLIGPPTKQRRARHQEYLHGPTKRRRDRRNDTMDPGTRWAPRQRADPRAGERGFTTPLPARGPNVADTLPKTPRSAGAAANEDGRACFLQLYVGKPHS
ncbi:unnamed protein product [Ixodes persulcatus]